MTFLYFYKFKRIKISFYYLSAHAAVVWTLKNLNLHWEIKEHWWILYFKDQYFSYRILCWHWSLIIHIFFQLQVHEKLGICLTINKVLNNNVIGTLCKTFISYRLNLQSKVEIWEIFERNWRHPNLILFSWDFNHPCILIDFEEFFETSNFRNLTTDADW